MSRQFGSFGKAANGELIAARAVHGKSRIIMKKKKPTTTDQQAIRRLLHKWRDATRAGRKDEVLANHAKDVLVYDPIPPFKYVGAAAYRKSFDAWWPESTGEGKFDLNDLEITAGGGVAYAHGVVACGGTTPSGETWEDRVRLTVCLRKLRGRWLITHTHSSMPLGRDSQ